MVYFSGVTTSPEPMGHTASVESDEALVARVLGGETAVFELLMRRHNRRVFRAARAILRNDTEAEDAMQEAYVAAFTHLRDFAGRARFSTWLVRIAVHEALGRLRKSKRLTSLDDGESEGADYDQESSMSTARSPEDAASDVEVRALLETAVDALPIAFRTVFVMRAVEEMTVGEVAEALEIPEETVRTRLHRARGLLRDALAQRLDAAAPSAFDFHLSRCDRVVDAVLKRIRQ
ncbi:MAG: polymerase sigma-54 factor RpoN [Labilithrix sp.]|jgi:RNA polymerase sigma-70 factor (ECF subfamily)|nr:polymerase sigma-54 factor RpoN [Labilithrix sp.]